LTGRTEPRDLYDINALSKSGDVDLPFLPANFAAKCHHKGKDPDRLGVALDSKSATFGKLWKPRLAVQVIDLPDLDEVLRSVRQHLRGLGFV
jgi:predicted nucleotidyltransferase component of viral defense system